MFSVYVDESLPDKERLTSWVRSLDFEEIDRDDLLYRNTRNAVYTFRPECYPREVILKRSRPSDRYRWHRRVSFYLRNFFKHYGRRGYYGAKLLTEAGIRTVKPLAYFKYPVGWLQFESCFLYEKAHVAFSVREFLEQQFDQTKSSHEEFRQKLIDEMARIVRELHEKRILHGDLIINNFLVSFVDEVQETESLDRKFDLIVIDTDHVARNWWPTRALQRIVAMKCLRRMGGGRDGRREFLKLVLGNDYREIFLYALEFWRWWDRRPFSRARKACWRRMLRQSPAL